MSVVIEEGARIAFLPNATKSYLIVFSAAREVFHYAIVGWAVEQYSGGEGRQRYTTVLARPICTELIDDSVYCVAEATGETWVYRFPESGDFEDYEKAVAEGFVMAEAQLARERKNATPHSEVAQ